jgi:hypothetical protein
MMLTTSVVACSRGGGEADASPAEGPSEVAAPAPTPEPLDLLGIELDTAPNGNAEPGDWVQCAGGTVALAAPGVNDPPSPAPIDPHENDPHGDPYAPDANTARAHDDANAANAHDANAAHDDANAANAHDANAAHAHNDANAPHDDANARAADGVRLCREKSQGWVDASTDEITVVARALNADELIVAGRRARFIGGARGPAVARVRVPLRPLMAQLAADRVATQTRLVLSVEVTHARGTARGELVLETPRVLKALTSIAAGLRFGDEADLPRRAGAPMIVLQTGPDPKVLSAPNVPLAAIANVALVTSQAVELPPCEGQTAPRAALDRTLTVFDRVSGRRLGDKTYAADAACPTNPPSPDSGAPSAGPDYLRDAQALADADLPERWVEPPVAREVVLPLAPAEVREGAPPEPEWQTAARAAPVKPDALHAWWTPLGLDPNATRADFEARFGPGISSKVDDVTLVQWSGGLSVAIAPELRPSGAIEADSVSAITFPATWDKAIDPVRSPALPNRAPIDALISQTAAAAIAALGRPSELGPEHLTWRLDAGAWGLGVTCELGPTAAVCTSVTLRWTRPAANDANAGRFGVDLARVAPKDPSVLRRFHGLLGLGPNAGRADLERLLGPTTSVSPARGGIETQAHGEHLGALVDAKTGTVLEVWIEGAGGREALVARKLDDPLLGLLGKPPAEAITALGRPDKLGEGFLSWTLDDGQVTGYVELRCEGEPFVCSEMVVGWLPR